MYIEDVTKKCSTCKETKSLDSFHANKGNKDGLAASCKPCQKEHNRKHYQANKRRYLDRNIALSRRNRLEIIEMKKKTPCLDCGGYYHPYIMEHDHRDPATKKFEISRCGKKSLKDIKSELEKCDLVCANCHKLRTFRRMQEQKTDFYVGY